MLENILQSTWFIIFIRVLIAVLLGFSIGLEREMTNKYAGLRTNILVCVGACVFTICDNDCSFIIFKIL